MMQAGKMRERITFQSKLETVQPSGAVDIQWVSDQTMRAELVQESAEAFLSNVERTEDRKVFRLWKAEWITTNLRLSHDDQTYRIVKIVPLGQLGLELHCVNAVNE